MSWLPIKRFLWKNVQFLQKSSRIRQVLKLALSNRLLMDAFCKTKTIEVPAAAVQLVYPKCLVFTPRFTFVSFLLQKRHYGTVDKQTTGLLSKLFPQTSVEVVDEAARQQEQRETEQEQIQEKQRQERRLKWSMSICGCSGLIISLWAIYFFGQPEQDDKGQELLDKYSCLPLITQYIARFLHSMANLQSYIKEPSSQKLLPDPLQPPYVQPAYTLVLELKDVLVHPDWTYETGWRFKKRPGVDIFLQECAKYFEIVVYTAEQGITVFPLLDALDPNGFIMYRLVRDSTQFVNGHHVKKLDNLNRDLSRVVVIDWDTKSTSSHPNNSFIIPRWNGNDDDTTLYHLISFLHVLGSNDVKDVREVIQYYNTFREPLVQFRENQRLLSQQLEADELAQKFQKQTMVKHWTRGFNMK